MKTRILGGTAAVALSFLASAPAQAPEVQQDVEFIRGLVTDLRFIDLAQYEVEKLKKLHKDSDDFKLIAQLAIEVSLQGAKRHPERSTRIALYREAIDKSAEFIERYSGQQVAQDARVTLAEACIEFGFFLNEELEIAREEDPEKVADLEEKAAAVFRQGIAATEKCRELFNAEGKKTEAYVSWLRKGILQREYGRAVKKDRTTLCREASETLEELTLEVGEETILGQKALLELSKISEVLGNLDAAITSYTDAIDAIYQPMIDEDLSLPESAQRIMFEMMQEIYDRLATVTYKAGRTGDIDALVKQYDDRVKQFRTVHDPRYWDSVRLTQAQVQAGSPNQADVSQALKSAQKINKEHPNDYVGLKAKNLIRNILSGSADLVTGALLLEVAIGDFQEKSYDAALAGFKRALNGMTADTKATHGFDTWVYIARCNQQMQRYLETSLAYSRALQDYGEQMKESGDEADEDRAKRAANSASQAMRRVITASGSNPVFAALKSTTDEQLKSFDSDRATAGDYVKGLRAKHGKKFAEAADLFFKVDPGYPRYELALGHGIECLFRQGKYDEARQKIKFLRDYTNKTPIDDNDRERRGYRPQALAWAHYTEGRILYELATGAKDGKPDLTKFKDVEKHFLEFEQIHGEVSSLQMPKVHEILGHAYLEMGDETKAAERYTKLKALGETRPDAHKALGALMFETYLNRAKALTAEVQAKPSAATQTKLRETQRRALDMGMDYARTVGQPQYAILYNAMRIAEELSAWPKCEWTAEKILKLYGDKNYTSLRQVKPLLGYAMLRQPGRMKEALDVLNEAEKDLKPKPGENKSSGFYEVQRYQALALGGWPAFDESGINFAPNPGMGKPDKAFDIYWFDRDFHKYMTHSQRNPKYSLGWYQYILECYYFAMSAQRIDDKFKTRAQTLYNMARSTDDFATLKALGDEGTRTHNLFIRIQ